MKLHEFKKILREEVRNVLREDTQLFNDPDQLQMSSAATEAFNTIDKVVNVVMKKSLTLNNDDSEVNRYWTFDLKLSGNAHISMWVTIFNDGRIKFPILRFTEFSNRKSDKKITKNDIKWLVNLLEIDNDKYNGPYGKKLSSFKNQTDAIEWLKTVDLIK